MESRGGVAPSSRKGEAQWGLTLRQWSSKSAPAASVLPGNDRDVNSESHAPNTLPLVGFSYHCDVTNGELGRDIHTQPALPRGVGSYFCYHVTSAFLRFNPLAKLH